MLYTDIKLIENRVENKMFYATVCYVMLLRMRILWYAIICSCYGVKFQCNGIRLQWYAMLQCTYLLYAVKILEWTVCIIPVLLDLRKQYITKNFTQL